MRSHGRPQRRRLLVVGPGLQPKCRERDDFRRVKIDIRLGMHGPPLMSERDPEDRKETKSQHGLIE